MVLRYLSYDVARKYPLFRAILPMFRGQSSIHIYTVHVELISLERAHEASNIKGFDKSVYKLRLIYILIVPMFRFALAQRCYLLTLPVSKHSPNQCIPLSPHYRNITFLNQSMVARTNRFAWVLIQYLRVYYLILFMRPR